jgi:6-phosphogluconolactonase
MNNNRPHLYNDADAAAAGCSEYILSRLRQAVEDRGQASIAVSGGKTPKLLFQHMRESDFPWERLGFFFVDERAVPPDDERSNFRLARENFLGPLHFPESNVFRIRGEIDPREAAARYAESMLQWFQLEPGKMPVFDVIHHGMGADGHTASLFPHEPLIEDRIGIAAAVMASAEPKQRITLLPGVLLVSRSTVFLVDGADKNAALHNVLLGELNPMEFPSQLLARCGKHCDWFGAGIQWPEVHSNAS